MSSTINSEEFVAKESYREVCTIKNIELLFKKSFDFKLMFKLKLKSFLISKFPFLIFVVTQKGNIIF